MKKLFSAGLCLCIVYFVVGQTKTKTISLFNNKLTMQLPPDVTLMTDEQVQIKYHKTPDKNTYFYSDHDADFSIVFSVMAENVKEEDLVKNKSGLISQFSAKGYKLEENEVRKVSNHNFIVVSFYSEVPDGRVFNKRFYAVADGELVMVAFNCTEATQGKRKPEIDSCINSTEIM
ncbi:MAG TPA: hypothetical protein VK588_04695 [Chitinophagaceae bacterium]|nr:hypothetical protein [Chitinophagaceae bacterium]